MLVIHLDTHRSPVSDKKILPSNFESVTPTQKRRADHLLFWLLKPVYADSQGLF